MATQIGRLITAMVTPFDTQGGVDYEGAKRLALALLESGSDGVVVSGTTGESPTLSHEEKVRLFREVKQAIGQRGAVIAGTGTYNTAESIALTKAAEATGVDAALLVVPYYNKPTQEGLYRHFNAIADSTRLACILYNVPSRTITNLLPETVARLAAHPNVVGIKEASGSIEQVKQLRRLIRRQDFHIWSGNDSDTQAMLEQGCYGVVSVASHLVGRQIKSQLDHAARGDVVFGRATQERLAPLFRDLFIVANPIPLKHALNQLGFPVGGLRLPLCEPDLDTAAKVMATVQACQIDLVIPGRAKVAAKS